MTSYLTSCKSLDQGYEVEIYGAPSAGIIAAVQTARIGRSVILIEPSNHLGGLTTGGLGRTDLGNADAVGAFLGSFTRELENITRTMRYGHGSLLRFLEIVM